MFALHFPVLEATNILFVRKGHSSENFHSFLFSVLHKQQAGSEAIHSQGFDHKVTQYKTVMRPHLAETQQKVLAEPYTIPANHCIASGAAGKTCKLNWLVN